LQTIDQGTWQSDDSERLTGRLAWLIMGFNVGFILPLLFVFLLLPNVLTDFAVRRAEPERSGRIAAATAYIVITQTASPTLPPTFTLQPPTATPTFTVTPDYDVTVSAQTRAALAPPSLEPYQPPTQTPTETPIPPTATPLPPPSAYQVNGVKFFRQTWNNCGPANLAMGLSFFNWQGTQEDTASYLKPDREDKNVSPQQMVDYVNHFTNLRAIWRMDGELEQVRWLAANGFVVIIEAGFEPRGEGWFGHYETVVAYDTARDTFTIYDSYLGRSSNPSIVHSSARFDQGWQAFNRNFIVIYPPAREPELQAFLGPDWVEQLNRREAVETAQQEAAEQPKNVFAWFNLGTSLTAIGRYEEAVVAYQEALNIGLPYRMLWYQFGPYEAFLQTGRLDEVLELANNTLKTTEYVEETYYYKGRVYEIQGDYAAARIQYEEAARRNPNYEQAQAALRRVEPPQ
jgi:hypothetical protein